MISVFAEATFGSLRRTDQRRWAEVYLRGLLGTAGKKTVRRLAAAVSDRETAFQSLHQFVNASPWDWEPVRRELTRWAEEHTAPRAWVLDDVVLRKRGDHSCGVHRRFSPADGRSVNGQVGTGLFLAGDHGALPVDWALYLPECWTADPARRRRVRIPDGIGHRPAEEQALGLVDALAAHTRLPAVPVVADASSRPGAEAFVRGLARRGHDFVVAVPGHLPLARAATALPGPVRADQGPAVYRAFTTRGRAGRAADRTWITNMPHARTDELLALTRTLGLAREAVRYMESDLGLGDFEGRSFPGWHHHMTLVSAAYAYSRQAATADLPHHLAALPAAA
ncbi:IS701 family transposase [Streptomyces lavendulae]|uniref:IS701 family transposase n=1 Tax=Streptomyces lavendulae TaxID=1914 RepID=UPI0025546C9A|nr:transposase [Streptomyces lavendulae]